MNPEPVMVEPDRTHEAVAHGLANLIRGRVKYYHAEAARTADGARWQVTIRLRGRSLGVVLLLERGLEVWPGRFETGTGRLPAIEYCDPALPELVLAGVG